MDNRVCLASVATGQVLGELKKHYGYVNSVTFSNCGKFIIAGGQDNISRLYHISDKDHNSKIKIKKVGSLKDHKLPVTSVAMSPNLNYVATGSRDS